MKATSLPVVERHSRLAATPLVPGEGGDGDAASDAEVESRDGYLVVVGMFSHTAREALRLTHVEGGADPGVIGTVWWPKEAPNA